MSDTRKIKNATLTDGRNSIIVRKALPTQAAIVPASWYDVY